MKKLKKLKNMIVINNRLIIKTDFKFFITDFDN